MMLWNPMTLHLFFSLAIIQKSQFYLPLYLYHPFFLSFVRANDVLVQFTFFFLSSIQHEHFLFRFYFQFVFRNLTHYVPLRKKLVNLFKRKKIGNKSHKWYSNCVAFSCFMVQKILLMCAVFDDFPFSMENFLCSFAFNSIDK